MDAALVILNHVDCAHWIIFGLFILAGLNFPISEDLLIILGGVLASTLIPENTWKIFAAIFFGAFLSDWILYWIGRKFGPILWKMRWFSRMIHSKRLEQIQNYYQKYGVATLFVGRFIPFGVRNCLFLTAGLGKVRFIKFLLVDGVACLLSNTILFSLSYYFGKNYSKFDLSLKWVNIAIFSAFLIALIAFFCYKLSKVSKEID